MTNREKANITMANKLMRVDDVLISQGYLKLEDKPTLSEYLELGWPMLAQLISALDEDEKYL